MASLHSEANLLRTTRLTTQEAEDMVTELA